MNPSCSHVDQGQLSARQGSLHVIHVCRQFRPGVGGLEAVVEALARSQIAQAMRVTIVTLNYIFQGTGEQLPAQEEMDGLTVIRIPYVGSRRYPIAPSVLKHLAGASIVHVHAVDFFFDFLALTRPLHGKTLVLSTHGGFFHTRFAARLKRIYFHSVTRTMLRAYAFVAASSQQDAEAFGVLRRAGIAAIENGVDTAKFRGAASAEPQRAIIYFGRLAPNKGLHHLLRWFAALGPDWRLIVAGKPMGVEIAELEAEARRLGIDKLVEFHDTPSDDALRQLIGRCSIYACASDYEGFGLAPVEAMSAGLFPVLSDIPAFRHTLSRARIGHILDFRGPRSTAGFLEAWEAWSWQPDRLQLLEAAAAGFDWRHVSHQFTDLYLRCLGRTKRKLLTLSVDVCTAAQAIDRIDDHVERAQPLGVAFCNAHMLNLAHADPALRAAVADFLLLNDGAGADIACRLLFGQRFPENLNGTDFTPRLLSETRHDLRIYLLGARQPVVERAAAVLAERWPRHRVVGFRSGYDGEPTSNGTLAEIATLAPDLILVAMGNPRQELWTATHGSRLPGVKLCVGAFLDFLVGEVPRAPAMIRRFRLEWAFRLMIEPKRLWRRYLIGNLLFLSRAAVQWARGDRA